MTYLKVKENKTNKQSYFKQLLFACIWHPELCTGVECDCDHVCSSPNSLPSMLADKDFPTEVKKKKGLHIFK